jgi:putative two-component system response regulator
MIDLSDCCVLVVDDVEENIDILVDALSQNYEVAVAMDGKAALEAVAEEMPDIILLDIMMPEMDGFEVCDRRHEAYTYHFSHCHDGGTG